MDWIKNRCEFRLPAASVRFGVQQTVTGVHDAPSVAAVKWLQKLAALPQTGEIDQTTWAYLSGLYTLASGDGDGADLHSGS